ncbi:MAG: universal stress protein [Sphingobacterium sp.]|nr:universal stress protein [Sphingobacterium sp.]
MPVSNPSTVKNLIDFSILIKDTKSKRPIYPLHVTPDTGNYEENIRNFNKLLEPSIQHAISTENNLFPITRIDLNPVQGIMRAAREMLITKTLIGWHGRTSTSDYIFGSLVDNLVNSYFKTVMIVKYKVIAQSMNNINVFVPDNAEYELGFVDWMKMLNNLSFQTEATVRFFGSANVLGRINSALEVLKLDMVADFKIMKSWENLRLRNLEIKKDDMTVMINARPKLFPTIKILTLSKGW